MVGKRMHKHTKLFSYLFTEPVTTPDKTMSLFLFSDFDNKTK